MKAIVTGMIATFPVAGAAWDYAQYVLGLEALGWDVTYLEDTGLDSYTPNPAEYLSSVLSAIREDSAVSWHYRSAEGTCFGLPKREMDKVLSEADLFLNISGGCLLRDEYLQGATRVLVDTDPGLNQFVNYPKWDREPGWQGTHGFRGHTHFLTYAERIGAPDCPLPMLGLEWMTTRPPVVLGRWIPRPPARDWTTVMSWSPYRHYRNPIVYDGIVYGSKEMEFEKIRDLPQRVSGVGLELAVGGEGVPVNEWRALGWSVRDAREVSETTSQYRDYIEASRGEFSVAKNVYVATRSGWFSTRSVCYLAAGRPVVLQDTGFSEIFPCGEGLLAFNDLNEAAEAISCVERDYPRHAAAAHNIAREYFASDVVLGDLLSKVGLG